MAGTPDPETDILETDDEETKKRKSNFKRVKEAREKEKDRADAAEAEAAKLRKEKEERDEADRLAGLKKLEEEGNLKALADAKQKEAEEKGAEAAREKDRADKAEARAKEYEDAQEEELKGLLEQIPEEKRPPLDPADPVSKRLKQVKHAMSLLESGPKPAVGGGVRKGQEQADRLAELKKKNFNQLTEDEAAELVELQNAK